MKRNITKFNKGFTLVELLVVIAIIAILSTVGLTLYSTAQGNARDARRKSDIDAIASALESTRTPGTTSYVSLYVSGFAAGTVPQDTGGTTYTIRTTVTSGVVPADPSTWAAAVAVPTLPAAGTGESVWTTIPSAGLPGGTGTQPFVTSTTGWKVCARLEVPATLTVYCKSSAQ